jgi:putative ABC transport system substrate-binding protein
VRLAPAGGRLSQADVRRPNGLAADRRFSKAPIPPDLPVEQPVKFDMVINMRTANALALAIPGSLLLRADEVIQ